MNHKILCVDLDATLLCDDIEQAKGINAMYILLTLMHVYRMRT